MALTQAERIQISGELLDLPLKAQVAQDTKAQLAGVKTDLLNQDGSLKIFFDKFNNIANSYQNEERWINGKTYATVVESDLVDAAKKISGNKFFPSGWTNFQPKRDDSVVGLPTTTSTGHEIEATSNMNTTIDLLLNGQSSTVPDDTTNTSYSGGNASLTMTSGGQTLGNLLILDTGTDSALVKVVGVANDPIIDVSEVVAPNATLTGTINVIENIPGWTNSERNTLTTANYQNVLVGVTNDLKTKVNTWETAVTNQKTELTNNGDTRATQASEIAGAIADADNALNVISTWKALPDTGTTGTDSKFTDNNLGNLQTESTARNSFATTRASQISTALGSVTQNSDGTFSGSGTYYDRFVQIDSRINLAGGPLTEYYEKATADQALTQIVDNANNRISTFESELKVTALAADGDGTNVISVQDATGFSISDNIYVVADGETELAGTITNISGNNVTLSFTVNNVYTVAKKARLYKQL